MSGKSSHPHRIVGAVGVLLNRIENLANAPSRLIGCEVRPMVGYNAGSSRCKNPQVSVIAKRVSILFWRGSVFEFARFGERCPPIFKGGRGRSGLACPTFERRHCPRAKS